jgi:hypothetical protein
VSSTAEKSASPLHRSPAHPAPLPFYVSSTKGQTTHSTGFSITAIFFSAFSAHKSHVKPQDPLTLNQSTTSAWAC